MGNFHRPVNFLAGQEFHRLFENRTGKGKGMELSVFTARINFRRQRADEIFIKVSAYELLAKIRIVYATNNGSETMRKKFEDEFARIHLPDWKYSPQADLRQILLTPPLEVFEENITKGTGSYAALTVGQQGCRHFLLILLVGTALADEYFLQRQADRPGLPLQKLQSHAMHGNALEMLVARGQQRDDFIAVILPETVQRQG